MPDHDPAWRTAEDVQMLENAMREADMPSSTRGALLKRASTSLLAAGGLGAIIAGCGSSSKSSSATASSSSSSSSSSSGAAAVQQVIDTAATAEALAVTYLSVVIKSSPGTPVAKFTEVLKAANAEEYDHYKALTGLGAKPLTTRF